MRIILNPKYQSLRPFLEQLETRFETGEEIHRGRNIIRTLEAPGGLSLCVKQYGASSFRGTLRQKLRRRSKARVAYGRPTLLRERGFESPESVAVVSVSHGFLRRRTMYYVSLLSRYHSRMDDVCTLPAEEKAALTEAFAHYVARLHNRGVLHRDFSSSNILYDRVDGRYRFSLVDTNAVRLTGAVSIEKGCRSLADLTGDDEFFLLLARTYARQRGVDEGLVVEQLGRARRRKQENPQ